MFCRDSESAESIVVSKECLRAFSEYFNTMLGEHFVERDKTTFDFNASEYGMLKVFCS